MSSISDQLQELLLSYLQKEAKDNKTQTEDSPSFSDEKYYALLHKYASVAHNVEFATHISKFIHSKTKTSNILLKDLSKTKEDVVDTASISDLRLDYSSSAAYARTASILALKDKETKKQLYEYALENDISIFDFINVGEEKKLELCKLLSNIKRTDSYKVDYRLKQIFFKDNDTYKILVPIFPTSLYQGIYDLISKSKIFNKDHKDKEDQEENEIVIFKDLVEMSFGGNHPQNVSNLNSKRQGIIKLLSCAPPKLRFKSINLKGNKNIFTERDLKDKFDLSLNNIRSFILRNKDKSFNYKNSYILSDLINDFASEVLLFLKILKDTKEIGWTETLNTKLAHKVFIDSKYYDDIVNINPYIDVISDDFASYYVTRLNREFDSGYGFKNSSSVIKLFAEIFKAKMRDNDE